MYLVTDATARLHRRPGGAVCTFNIETGGLRKIELNTTALELMDNVCGLLVREDIVTRFCENHPTEAGARQAAEQFLAQAVAQGMVQEVEAPAYRQPRRTGSSAAWFPQHVMFELTYDCNLRCGHCYNSSGFTRHARLETHRLVVLMEELARGGARVVELTGGEPTMHPDFDRIVSTAAELFDMVAVLTNGWFITEARADLLARLHAKLIVQVDLDGPSAQEHDALRGIDGSFERAQRAVRRLAERGVTVRAASSLTPATVHELPRTIELGHRLGARFFAYTLVLPIGRGAKLDARFSADDLAYLTGVAEWADAHYPGFISRPTADQRRIMQQRPNCGAGYDSITVTPTGQVTPCPMLASQGVTLGNLVDEGAESLFASRLQPFFHDLTDPRSTPECAACESADGCRGCAFVGVIKHRELGERCVWGERYRIDEVTGGRTVALGCAHPSRGEPILIQA